MPPNPNMFVIMNNKHTVTNRLMLSKKLILYLSQQCSNIVRQLLTCYLKSKYGNIRLTPKMDFFSQILQNGIFYVV